MPLARRRLARLAELAEEAVQLAGRDARGVLVEERLDAVEHALDAAAGLRRDGDDRRPLAQLRLQPRAHVLDRHVRQVPLGQDDEGRAARLARHVGHGEILLDDALARVDEHERDVGPLGGRERAQLRVVLDPLALVALAPQPGRVDEHELALAAPQHRVDRVARRAGHLGDDRPLLAEQLVQQARLADVRPAEDRDADRLVADRGLGGAGQRRDDRVEQVAGAVAVQRGERDRVAEPEPVELERVHVAARVVDLVREQEHRLVRAAQDRGQLLVAGRDARPARRRRRGRGRPRRSPPAPARRSSA